MQSPRDFEWALDISFSIMYVIYAAIAAAGYLVYGDTVDVLVSVDISNFPGGWVSTLLTSLIVSGCMCTIAPVISILGKNDMDISIIF